MVATLVTEYPAGASSASSRDCISSSSSTRSTDRVVDNRSVSSLLKPLPSWSGSQTFNPCEMTMPPLPSHSEVRHGFKATVAISAMTALNVFPANDAQSQGRPEGRIQTAQQALRTHLPRNWWEQKNLLSHSAPPIPFQWPHEFGGERRLTNGIPLFVGDAVMFGNDTIYAVPKEGPLVEVVKLPTSEAVRPNPPVLLPIASYQYVAAPAVAAPLLAPVAYDAALWALSAVTIAIGIEKTQRFQSEFSPVTPFWDRGNYILVFPAPTGEQLNDRSRHGLSPLELGTLAFSNTSVITNARQRGPEPCVAEGRLLYSPLQLSTDGKVFVSPGNPGAAIPGTLIYYENILKPNGRLVGRQSSGNKVRELGGTQDRFLTLFNVLAAGSVRNRTTSYDGIFCILPNSQGTLGLRLQDGKPANIDPTIPNIAIRKIKYVPQ